MRNPCVLVFIVLLFLAVPSRGAERVQAGFWVVGRSADTVPTAADKRNDLLDLLRAKEPPSEEQIRGIGSKADSVLADIISNTDMDMITRRRAVTALGHFQNKRASQLLNAVITDPAWKKPLRVAALVAYAQSVGHDAFQVIKEYAQHPDDEIRTACVEALGVIGDRASRELLKDRQLREQNPGILELIDRSLRETKNPFSDDF